MNGWCKFTAESPNGLVILYSLEENRSCDGMLFFDKDTKELSITRLSRGATTDLTKHFICAVRGRIRRGFELNKIYYLAVG